MCVILPCIASSTTSDKHRIHIIYCTSDIHNYKLFLRRKSHVSMSTTFPKLTTMTISFWMRTQQDSEGTAVSYATQSQPNELVIKTHPSVRVILKGSPQGDETDWDLNDGNWHFLWIEWESTTGHLKSGKERVLSVP